MVFIIENDNIENDLTPEQLKEKETLDKEIALTNKEMIYTIKCILFISMILLIILLLNSIF